eukprot:gene17266-17456_t
MQRPVRFEGFPMTARTMPRMAGNRGISHVDRVIPAKIFHAMRRHDGQILHASPYNLIVSMKHTPCAGEVVDIVVGALSMRCLVTWSGADRFGARLLDRIDLGDLLRAAPRSTVPGVRGTRLTARPRAANENHEASRALSEAMQFVAQVVSGVMAATMVAYAVRVMLVWSFAPVIGSLTR